MKIEKGMNIIELLVVIAIVGIVTSLAAPSFKDFWRKTSTASQINMLRDTLMLARSEAITRGANVGVCASTNGTGCRCTADTGDCLKWEGGWISYVDVNNDGTYNASDGALLEQVGPLKGDSITLRATLTNVTFEHRGNITDSKSFVICDAGGQKNAKAVNVYITGSVSIATDTDTTADDIVNDVSGTDVACP